MKILSCAQQKEADAYTISNENILSINLMEKRHRLLPMRFANDGTALTAS